MSQNTSTVFALTPDSSKISNWFMMMSQSSSSTRPKAMRTPCSHSSRVTSPSPSLSNCLISSCENPVFLSDGLYKRRGHYRTRSSSINSLSAQLIAPHLLDTRMTDLLRSGSALSAFFSYLPYSPCGIFFGTKSECLILKGCYPWYHLPIRISLRLRKTNYVPAVSFILWCQYLNKSEN